MYNPSTPTRQAGNSHGGDASPQYASRAMQLALGDVSPSHRGSHNSEMTFDDIQHALRNYSSRQEYEVNRNSYHSQAPSSSAHGSYQQPSQYPGYSPTSSQTHVTSQAPTASGYSGSYANSQPAYDDAYQRLNPSYNPSQEDVTDSDPALRYSYGPSEDTYDGATAYDEHDQPMVDHFAHDTEAYSSGLHARYARSRSPTPMADDEDVHVNDYESYDSESLVEQEKGKGYGPEPVVYNSHADYLHARYGIPKTEYAETLGDTQHYGPAPIGRVHRRNKIKKRVQLTRGNLVLDIHVPTKLVLPLVGGDEMLKTRYTAVTCDPDDFERNNFFLRQNESGRQTEMFIVITMYNEDEILFCRTLLGVMRNISHLCTRKNSQTWGRDSWKKVVVCIVADGRKKIHPRVLDCLAALGVYQPGDFMKNMINGKPVTAHLFEYTTTFGLDENLHFKYPDKGIVPTQILFCLKEKNKKKINSHRWFFNAFAPLLQPNICVLLDVGTRPGHKSLYHLWKTFDLNSNVGGACGDIEAYKGKHWLELLNPLIAAQNFEYKISGILDKTTESLFGYISVLPGAFSAYRYIALQNNRQGVGPLASYFKGEVLHGRDTDIFTSNMYLAEDRILCFELVAKENADWVLRYVKPAVGVTDVPDGLPEFISQRRRWLNGSFFAAVYAIAHTRQILRSGHSTGRKVVLFIETLYNIINLIFAWFAIGNFYLFFIIVTSSLEVTFPDIRFLNSVIQYAYASIVVACFLFSMGNRPRAAPWKYKLSVILFALINAYALVCAVFCTLQAARQGGRIYSTMLFSILITFGAYAVSSLLALDPWHMLTSFLPYMLLSPTYVNVLNIYAFANLDDISWGTKQDNEPDTDLGAVVQNVHSQVDVEVYSEPSDVNQMYMEALDNLRTRKVIKKAQTTPTDSEMEQQAKDYYANVRTNVLLLWVLSNGVLVTAVLNSGRSSDVFRENSQANAQQIYMTVILAFVAITNIIRFAGSTVYILIRIFTG